MKLINYLSTPVLFFLLAGFALAVSIYRPFYNWDMIGYIAAAKSFEERDIESLHSFSYNQLRETVPTWKYEELTNGVYRHTVSAEPAALKEQLPFYQIRPVYTGLIYLLYRTGVSIGFATHIIPGVAIAISVFFLYLMSTSFIAKPLIYAIPPLAVIFGALDLARVSTPDGLAFLAAILSTYLYMKRHIILLLILLPIMVGIRTDYILFAAPLLFFVFVFERKHRLQASLSMFVSLLIYSSIATYWKHPGWSTIFYFTFVENLPYPISQPPSLTVEHYFYALYNMAKSLTDNKPFVLYTLVAAYSLYQINNLARTTSVVSTFMSPSTVLAVTCLIYTVSHLLTFPALYDRFFSSSSLIGVFSLLMMITDRLMASKSRLGLLADQIQTPNTQSGKVQLSTKNI